MTLRASLTGDHGAAGGGANALGCRRPFGGRRAPREAHRVRRQTRRTTRGRVTGQRRFGAGCCRGFGACGRSTPPSPRASRSTMLRNQRRSQTPTGGENSGGRYREYHPRDATILGAPQTEQVAAHTRCGVQESLPPEISHGCIMPVDASQGDQCGPMCSSAHTSVDLRAGR